MFYLPIGVILGLYWDNGKEKETTIVYWGYTGAMGYWLKGLGGLGVWVVLRVLGFRTRVWGLGFRGLGFRGLGD